MRTVITAMVLTAVLWMGQAVAVPSPAVAADPPAVVTLFDGKSLDGWVGRLVDPNVKTEDVWSVQDGILVCKGEPLGYLETKQAFDDFILVVEWRWAPGKEPGNSGVLLRINGEPIGFMPKCVEAQLKSGSAGDIWAFRGASVTGPEDRFRKVDNPALGEFVGVGKIEAAENEPGQWNKYVIVCYEDTLTLFVNGKKVNEAGGLNLDAGTIGLQSEGAEIHFRTVTLVPLSH